MNPAALADLLQVYGGWGMVAVLLVAIVGLYKNMTKVLEKRNDQFVDVLKESGAALKQTDDTMKEVKELLKQATTALERFERVMERVEDRLNNP